MSGLALYNIQLVASFIFIIIIASSNGEGPNEKDGVWLSQANLNAIFAVFAILAATTVGLTVAFVCLYKRVTAKKTTGARMSTTISEHQYEQVIYNTEQLKSKEDVHGYLVPNGSQSKHAKGKIHEKSQNVTDNLISIHENQPYEKKIQSKNHIYEKIPQALLIDQSC